MTAQVYGATGKVSQSGDTMTGTLVLTGSPPLKVTTGAAVGSVLGSDASGNATWGFPTADWINVKWWGAKGDGSTDDATAIQNAINAAHAGQVVYFPAGTYIVGTTLTLASNVLYLGSDEDNTIIKMKAGANLAAVAATTGWVGSTATYSVNPLHIQHLGFDGNRSAQTGGTGHGVVLQTYYATVEGCTFENTLGDGLRFDAYGANGTTVIGNTMVENRVERIQCRSNGGSGFVVNDGTHNKATDGWLRDCIVDTPGVHGIWIGAGAGWTVDGCHVYNIPQSGIRVDRAFETRIINNYVESCGSSTTVGTYALIDCINFAANDNGQGSVIATNTVYFQGPPGNVGSTIAGIAFQSASGGSANVAIVGNQVFCTGTTGLSAILLQNQSNTASLSATVSGNNLVGWTNTVQQVTNSGTMSVIGDNLNTTVGPVAVQPTASANTALSTNVNGTDTFDRFRLLGSGTMVIGSGTAARDVQLARTAAGLWVFTNPVTSHGALFAVDGNIIVGGQAGLGDNGVGVLSLTDASTVPTTNPTGGVALYSVSGASIPARLRDTSGKVRGLAPAVAVATSGQNLTSSTTQTASTQLTLTVEASATYDVTGWAYFSQTAAGSATFAFTAPSGATMVWGAGGDGYTLQTAPTTITGTWTTNTTGIGVWFFGTLTTSATAGSLTLTFAQGASSANTLTLMTGSLLRLERVK